MSVVLTDDQIDFAAYMAEPEARMVVKPASHWRDELIQSFAEPEVQRGAFLPWGKARELFRLRHDELTLWPGTNGHGKSIMISQIMACAMAQGERCLLASMEMRPRRTLNRMARQCTGQREPERQAIDAFNGWTDGRLWIYDHLGAVQWKRLLAVFRWAAVELEITHFVIDSLMRCGIADDDYNGQKAFADALCVFKADHNVAVHLVMHNRKGDSEYDAPDKNDAKGNGTMLDLADNILVTWRNKRKEDAREQGGLTDDLIRQPDTMLICKKQRNFDWEGKIGLWYHRDSMQFIENGLDDRPIDLMEWGM
jgi:twinkle protein